MIKSLLLLVSSLFYINVYSQCSGSSVYLSSQSDVDNFPSNYPGAIYTGYIAVVAMNSNITNLNGLASLTKIQGCLTLFGTDLTSLHGLHNLVEITETFEMNLTLVPNFDEMVSLQKFSSLLLNQNSLLTKLPPIAEESTMDDISISSNPLLTDLSQLENVKTVENTLGIQFSPIANVNFLKNLISVFSLGISYNPNLVKLDGLNNLETVTNIFIAGNPLLSSCAINGVCQAIAGSGIITIRENATGCSSKSEVSQNCSALPVKLIEFKASSESKITCLKWSTASETQSKSFEIEHSLNTNNWMKIGSVKSEGESNAIREYYFLDLNPSEGNNYYRLKMVDLDNSYAYSNIIVAKIQSEAQIVLSPNPASDYLQITGLDWTNIKAIELFDSNGQKIKVLIKTERGRLSVGTLTSGLYVLKVIKGDLTETSHKFLITR